MPSMPERQQIINNEIAKQLVFDKTATERLRTKEILQRHYDVVVVGAGPGGATTAGALARQGFHVLLLDRQPPGRNKTCGDAVSSRGVGLLDNLLGLKIDTTNPPPLAIEGITIVAPNKKELRLPLPFKENQEYPDITWPRAQLDKAIFDQAMNLEANGDQNVTGSITFLQVHVRDLLRNSQNNNVIGVTGNYNGETVKCYGNYIIGADGATSAIARAVDFDPGEKAIAARAYGKVVDKEKLKEKLPHLDIGLIYRKDIAPAYEWIFFLSETDVNVGLGVFNQQALRKLQKQYDSSNSLQQRALQKLSQYLQNFGLEIFNQYVKKLLIEEYNVPKNMLKHLMEEFYVRLEKDYGIQVDKSTEQIWSIPVWLKRRIVMFENGRVILIGDAAADTDPLTAGGIGPSIEGANIVTQVLIKIRDEDLSIVEAKAELERLRERLINQKMEGRLKAQEEYASKPWLLNALFRIATILPKKYQIILLKLFAGAHVSE